MPEARHKTRCQFTASEDTMLKELVAQFGIDNWDKVACHMPGRNPRQCRERWTNFVDDNVCRDKWSMEEDALLLEKYRIYGSKWKYLEMFFPGRKNYSIRNRLHSLLHQMQKLEKRQSMKRQARSHAKTPMPPSPASCSPTPSVEPCVSGEVTSWQLTEELASDFGVSLNIDMGEPGMDFLDDDWLLLEL